MAGVLPGHNENNMLSTAKTNSINDKVFVKDPQKEWIPGTVVDLTPDRALVRTENDDDKKSDDARNKRLSWYSLKDYHDHVLPLQNEKVVRDMAELPHLHEAAMLYLVRERHFQQKQYTRVGDIIVAVNPYKWLPDVYSIEQQKMYADYFLRHDFNDDKSEEEKKDDGPLVVSSTAFASVYDRLGFEPHAYEISASALRELVRQKTDQTILVSGESGSGKTETVKLVLQHLIMMEKDMNRLQSEELDADSSALYDHIIESSPIFEAFGNAKTLRNNNSSRFGKVTQLHFGEDDDGDLHLKGSSFETYLLETSRVVAHSNGERNFHIFYQLLSASPQTKKDLLGSHWGYECPEDFRFLAEPGQCNVSATSDFDDWEKTFHALKSFSLRARELDDLIQALGTILRLGNIIFEEADDGNATILYREDLCLLADSLGIPMLHLDQCLTKRELRTAQEKLDVPHTVDQAKEACDALAKTIYSVVFSWLVEKINEQTHWRPVTKPVASIALVDIFGFESFEVNRFEQLCINYANEKLQFKYVQDNINKYKSEYDSEGIVLSDFKVVDNSDVLDLFESRGGLIDSLIEECVMLSGTSENFVSKVKSSNKSNSRLIAENLHHQNEFGVHHYAGPVTYDASSFLESNADKLPEGLMRIVTRSSNTLISKRIQDVLANHEAIQSRWKKGSKNVTVVQKFRNQLRELLARMDGSHTRYIRCIKPNDFMRHDLFDNCTTLRQLKCAGLITAIELSREIFPNKLSFHIVERRFHCLMEPEHLANIKQMPLHDKVQYMMCTLLLPYAESYLGTEFTVPYACGKSKIFFRSGVLEILENRRIKILECKAGLIQRQTRRFVCQSPYQKLRLATIKVQAWHRGYKCRLYFCNTVKCIVLLQAAWRSSSQRSHFRSLQRSAKTAQFAIRAHQARTHYKSMRMSSITLQAWHRKNVCYQSFLKISRAVVTIQRFIRGWCHRSDFIRCKLAAIPIQAIVRRMIEEHRYDTMKTSVVLIQAWSRRFIVQQRFSEQREISCTESKQEAGGLLNTDMEIAALRIQHFYKQKRSRSATEEAWTIGDSSNVVVQEDHVEVNTQKAPGSTLDDSCAAQLIQNWWSSKKAKVILREIGAPQTPACVASGDAMEQESDVPANDAIPTTAGSSGSNSTAAIAIQKWWRDKRIKVSENYDCCDDTSSALSIESGSVHSQGKVLIEWASQTSGEEVAVEQEQVAVEQEQEEELHDKETAQQKLSEQAEMYRQQVKQLRAEIQQVTEEAELHNQELQADFEEKLLDYEAEVLQLKEELRECNNEKNRLKDEFTTAKEHYILNIEKLRQGVTKTQESQRKHTDRLMGMLRSNSDKYEREMLRLFEELASVKREKDTAIHALQQEVDTLRANLSMQSLPNKESLGSTLDVVISPEYIMDTVEQAYEQPGLPELYVDRMISCKVREEMESLRRLASEQVTHETIIVTDSEEEIRILQQQLVWAYEEIERLQNDESSKMNYPDRSFGSRKLKKFFARRVD